MEHFPSRPFNEAGDRVAVPGTPELVGDQAVEAIRAARAELVRSQFRERCRTHLEQGKHWGLVPREAQAEILEMMAYYASQMVRARDTHMQAVLKELAFHLPALECAPDPRDEATLVPVRDKLGEGDPLEQAAELQ